MLDLSALTTATVISPFGRTASTGSDFQPLWRAEVTVLKLAEPQINITFRNLFLENSPRRVFEQDNVLLPGRMILLCRPQVVTLDLGSVKKPIEGNNGSDRITIPNLRWTAPIEEVPKNLSYQQLKESLQVGALSLLLVEPRWPEGEISEFAELSCLAGEILLDKLLPEDGADTGLYQVLNLEPIPLEDNRDPRFIGALSVHSSGLTIYGQIELPWKQIIRQDSVPDSLARTTLNAPFQLSWRALGISPRISPDEQYFLRIELERLNKSETNALLMAWQQFGYHLNPGNPQNPLDERHDNDRDLESNPLIPNWSALEPVSYQAVPRLYWTLSNLAQGQVDTEVEVETVPSIVQIQSEDLNLILSDQNLYNPLTPPTSIAKLKPELIQVSYEGEHLNVVALAGSDVASNLDSTLPISNQLQYRYNPSKSELAPEPNAESEPVLESWKLIDITVAFSPVETPRFIREIQNLPIPTWDSSSREPIAEPRVWGLMPLEDGFAELPIPNLTEQIYIDSDIANSSNSTSSRSILFQEGAVSYGNQQAGVLAIYCNEQPWNLTFTDAEKFRGQWKLEEREKSYRIQEIALDFTNPELIINGLLWLSTELPSIENSLPSFTNWFSCLESIPLRSVKLPQLENKNEQYPSLIQLKLENLGIANRQEVLLKAEPGEILNEDSSLNLSKLAERFKLAESSELAEKSNKKCLPLSDIQGAANTSPDISVTEIQSAQIEGYSDWQVQDQKEKVKYFIQLQKVEDSEPLEGDNEPSKYKYTIQTVPSTTLLDWSFNYSVDSNIFRRFVKEKVLPANLFVEYPPLVWKRHPSLPMIQSLPLTQSKNPPNHPSSSRQYVPFELQLEEFELQFELQLEETEELISKQVSAPIPKGWKFGVSNAKGATVWPQLLEDVDFEPAEEWQLADLGWSSLSLPGLVLYPPQKNGKANGLDPDAIELNGDKSNHSESGESKPHPTLNLILQFRHDLPYTDELHALAQLPKVPRDPEAISPLPDSPLPEPIQPLTRELYGQYWNSLSERASLASLDGVNAFTTQDTDTFIEFLVEPYLWKVNPPRDEDFVYPGQLLLQPNYPLTGKQALESFSGRFGLQDDQLVLKTDSGESDASDFILEAGSMAAFVDSDSGFRDQRGLTRQATNVQSEILTTTVRFHRTIDQEELYYELTSTQQVITLKVAKDQVWQLWFRDLPIQVFEDESEPNQFLRKATPEQREDGITGVVSEFIQDINDPEALSRNHNFLSGYEWRLADKTNAEKTQNSSGQIQPLLLLGLHFYPLTLESVVMKEEDDSANGNRSLQLAQIEGVELIGRLQLPSEPVDQAREWEELGNAVRITFINEGEGLKLDGISIENPEASKSSYIEWPLYFDNAELSDAPRLLCNQDDLIFDRNTQELQLSKVQVEFILFGELWKVELSSPLTFSASQGGGSVTSSYTFEPQSELAPKELQLTLNLEGDVPHQAFLTYEVRLGKKNDLGKSSFYARVRFDLTGALEPFWEECKLFDHINIAISSSQVFFKDNAIQFAWEICEFENLYLLPGIRLKPSKAKDESIDLPGFSALTFSAANTDQDIPEFQLETAFVETVILCQWGDFLQSAERLPDSIEFNNLQDPKILGSSAGDLAIGYTGYWQNASSEGQENSWKETFLLNGFLEVKNLISFPQAIRFTFTTEPRTKIIFPGLVNGEEQPLDHLRHTARILFNQHQIDGGDLIFAQEAEIQESGETQLLFNFKSSWKTLAVVENQLIDIIDESIDESQENFVTDHLEVLYKFRFNDPDKENRDDLIIYDHSVIDNSQNRSIPVNLKLQTVSGNTLEQKPWEWLKEGGLAFKGDDAIAISETIPTELVENLKSTNAITIEAWIKSTNLYQEGPARIVTLSEDTEERNFTLGQGVGFRSDGQLSGKPTTVYSGRLRTDDVITDNAELLLKGRPGVYTPTDSLTTSHFSHVVYVRHADGKVQFYLDGVEQILSLDRDSLERNLWSTGEWARNIVPGTFQNWSPFSLALGNEIGGGRAWQGEYRRLAIYSRALTPREIRRHYRRLSVLALKRCDRRWTAIQEVSFSRPEAFQALLEEQDNRNTLDPRYGIDTLDNASDGYFSKNLKEQLIKALDRLSPNTLLVEASTVQWLSTKPVASNSPTRLQFLPNGVQLATLSDLEDFLFSNPQTSESDPQQPEWLLLNFPFLGRLQPETFDFQSSGSGEILPTPLQIDPIYYLRQASQASENGDLAIAQALTHWGTLATDGSGSINLFATSFDTALGRTWVRLDSLSLEQNWVQLQRATSNSVSTGGQPMLASIMNALPDTPGRLSHPSTLGEIYPKSDRNSLLITQGVSDFVEPNDLQLLYIFNENSGTVVHDVSGVGEPLDLTIQNGDATKWITGELPGLAIEKSTLLISDQAATKLIETCKLSNEISIEVWVKPTDIAIEFRLIVALAANNTMCNFVLGQGVSGETRFFTRLRTRDSSLNGLPALQTKSRTVQEQLTHIVYTRQANGSAQLYLDGEQVDLDFTTATGDFKNWDAAYRFALANEPTQGRPWIGEYYLVAVYSRALSSSEIQNNFDLGIENRRRQVRPNILKSWHLTGLQLVSSPLVNLSPSPQNRLNYYLAATLLPTSYLSQVDKGREEQNQVKIKQPISFAVSPYIGLKFQSLHPQAKPSTELSEPPTILIKLKIVSVELLGLDVASGILKPISSLLQEALQDIDQNGELDTEQMNRIMDWAKETQRRLAPESPLAVLRFREIREVSIEEKPEEENLEEETLPLPAPVPDSFSDSFSDSVPAGDVAPLITTYSFAIVESSLSSRSTILSQRSFRLRTRVEELRFREGQFGGVQLPAGLQPFELAPPQTIGVQPLYSRKKDWPWGLSALRLSVQYTEEENAVIGSPIVGKSDNSGNSGDTNNEEVQFELWWQALQYQVQYRSLVNSDDSASNISGNSQPAGGLPSKFRAPAIASFLPVGPQFPLPSQFPFSFDADSHLTSWQPILPGSLHYFMVGDRPGAMLAIRPQLFKQQLSLNGTTISENESNKRIDILSGSIPIQHRVPRPVSLPLNDRENALKALQPWASYFDPNDSCFVAQTPVDEAFFAVCKLGQVAFVEQNVAKGLRVELKSPARGMISTNWDGDLIIDLKSEPESQMWQLKVELSDGSQTVQYPREQTTELESGEINLTFKDKNNPEENPNLKRLQKILSGKTIGSTLSLSIKVKPKDTNIDASFYQFLNFTLRIFDPNQLRLPLEPYFIHFEDPEYNRRLASPTATASRAVQLNLVAPNTQEITEVVEKTIKLACDRPQYNPDSTISLRFDWDDGLPDLKSQLQFKRIDPRTGIPLSSSLEFISISSESDASGSKKTITGTGKLHQIQFLDQQGQTLLSPGDTIQCELKIQRENAITEDNEPKDNEPLSLSLNLDIVEQRVDPVPEAAYALLKQVAMTGLSKKRVECSRFAWNPVPARIELVCAEDLRTEVVRRRAIFHWLDTVRTRSEISYFLQKITQTGSTYIPQEWTLRW